MPKIAPYIKGTDFGSEASLLTSSPNCNLLFAPQLKSDAIAKDLVAKLDLLFVITLRGTPFGFTLSRSVFGPQERLTKQVT